MPGWAGGQVQEEVEETSLSYLLGKIPDSDSSVFLHVCIWKSRFLCLDEHAVPYKHQGCNRNKSLATRGTSHSGGENCFPSSISRAATSIRLSVPREDRKALPTEGPSQRMCPIRGIQAVMSTDCTDLGTL